MTSIPAEAFYDRTRVTDVAVSSDGDRVAFCTREYDPDEEEAVDSLWVVPADGSRDPHRLSRASDAGDPRWSPDGSRLAFLAAREADADLRVGRNANGEEASETGEGGADEDGEGAANGDDGPKTQVWAFEMERGGDARQVTDREEGVSGFDWSPDGERVVVAARDPTDDEREYLEQRREDGPIEVERLQHKFDGRGYLDEVTSYLFVVDYSTREERRLDDANDGGYGAGRGLEPAWGPSDRIAFTANHTDWPDDNYVRDVYTIDPDGTDRRQVTDGEFAAHHPRWSPDGERLAFLARPPENLYVPTEVYVTDRERRGYESASAALDRTVAWGGGPRWLDEGTLVALFGDGGWSRPVRLSADGAPERVFAVQNRTETLGELDVGGDTVAVATSRPGEGTDVDAFEVEELDAADEDPRVRLTDLEADLVEAHPMPGCERIAFDSADGTEIEALVYHPDDFDPAVPDPRGLVLEIHGGPMAYDEPGFRFLDAFFASRGYLVCRVNYRGSTSYGRAFCEVLRGAWGTVEVDDL
jgi:dipeptidyl aminopeptidase/acylaminoacyl peptidase